MTLESYDPPSNLSNGELRQGQRQLRRQRECLKKTLVPGALG